MIDEQALRAFGALIVRLQMGGDLSRDEAREAYAQIFRGDQPDLQAGALIAAHRTKGQLGGRGETLDEIVGVTEAHNDEWARHFPHEVEAAQPHLGMLGVGMDSLKTVNVTSAAAVIAAACGVYVHKVGAPGMTGVSGSADVFALWGVDPEAPAERQIASTVACRLGFTSAVGAAVRGSGIFRVLSQMRCGTALHFAGPLGFHSGERHKIIGVPRPEMTGYLAEAMRGLGYTRGLVVCGGSSDHPDRYLDEVSNLGVTHVCELRGGAVESYTLTPEACGLPERKYAEVETRRTAKDNARTVLRAMGGKGPDAIAELLALNAAVALKLMGVVDDVSAGVRAAMVAIDEGRAIEQLKALIQHQNAEPDAGLARVEQYLAG